MRNHLPAWLTRGNSTETQDGNRVLHWACFKGNPEIVKLVLDVAKDGTWAPCRVAFGVRSAGCQRRWDRTGSFPD